MSQTLYIRNKFNICFVGLRSASSYFEERMENKVLRTKIWSNKD